MKFMQTVRALIGYGQAWREFAAYVQQRRHETVANLDEAMARWRERPCRERLDAATLAFTERLGFEEKVHQLVRLDPVQFMAEWERVA